MSFTINNINGYILAGGKSSRMGIDKGLILFNQQPIVQHIINKMTPLVKNVVIISNNPIYENFKLEVLTDLIKNIGPAGGIQTALNHTDTEKNIIVSCDTPFVTTNSLAYIIRQSVHSQITVPVYNDKLHPLHGVYSKECASKWLEIIQLNILKLHEIISHFELLKVNVDDNPFYDEDIFFNINTKEDLKIALKMI